ncbi:MAG: hypothetical protein AAGI44_07075 [Pseudomonadota bacterium]
MEPMQGVNETGFWEDSRVVSINERLLALLGHRWYYLVSEPDGLDWSDGRFDELRSEAASRLKLGFGDGPLQAVKDPRFSLTLSFWLGVCRQEAISSKVFVVNRAPLEVAQSLERRDKFPVGYGLRLYISYRELITMHAPSDTVYIRYDQLIEDTPAVVKTISDLLPISPLVEQTKAVQKALRHQEAEDDNSLLARADNGDLDLIALADAVELSYPIEKTLQALAEGLVERGLELSDLGEEHRLALDTLNERDSDIAALSLEHRNALSTIDQRDADIEMLAAEHTVALSTIDERDEQIREFDRRLSILGDEHSHALQIVQERDAQLAQIREQIDKLSSIPGVGFIIRQAVKHARR